MSRIQVSRGRLTMRRRNTRIPSTGTDGKNQALTSCRGDVEFAWWGAGGFRSRVLVSRRSKLN